MTTDSSELARQLAARRKPKAVEVLKRLSEVRSAEYRNGLGRVSPALRKELAALLLRDVLQELRTSQHEPAPVLRG